MLESNLRSELRRPPCPVFSGARNPNTGNRQPYAHSASVTYRVNENSAITLEHRLSGRDGTRDSIEKALECTTSYHVG
ncbi:hypothetical protein M514_07934 [Trichuris suis]|uniref:Uncharacterized protein n=1 Tax=Trichuris suis TaxID=68888 RepID=A0A085M1S4_9BILA|nr:hypothetical protein M513_07934 [Trichuris suis]KFD69438.1 hypothetical protein M514_07934 [Trichuris suis]